jgi:hypothetical protein
MATGVEVGESIREVTLLVVAQRGHVGPPPHRDTHNQKTHDVMLTWTEVGLVIYAIFVIAAALPDEIAYRRYRAALKKRRSRSCPPRPVRETDDDEQ